MSSAEIVGCLLVFVAVFDSVICAQPDKPGGKYDVKSEFLFCFFVFYSLLVSPNFVLNISFL